MSSYPLFHSHSLSLTSHLSPLHLPHTLLLAFSSPSPLYLPWIFPPCLFISLTSSSPMGFSLTFSSPQLIAPSISYLNSPLPITPTIGDALKIFFCPLCLCGGLCMKDANFFSFALWLDLWILWYVLLLNLYFFIFSFLLDLWVLNLGL